MQTIMRLGALLIAGFILSAGQAPANAQGGDTTKWSFQQKLVPIDAENVSHFGAAVAIDRDIMVVGSSLDDLIVGDTAEQSSSGSVYVYTRTGSIWIETAKLQPSEPSLDFGWSVDIDGDTIVIGAQSSYATAQAAGAAYVFVKPVGGWNSEVTEAAKLLPSNGGENDRFGLSVGISGRNIVVGTASRDSAYVFVEPNGGWDSGPSSLTESVQLTTTEPETDLIIGNSVAIDGNLIVADRRFLGPDSPGGALVYVEPVGGWSSASPLTESAQLLSPFTEDTGLNQYAVDVHDGVVVVGNWNYGQSEAYVFTEPENGWDNGELQTLSEPVRLSALDVDAIDAFGSSVEVNKRNIVVGAFSDDFNLGSAYVFDAPNGGWDSATEVINESAKLVAPNRGQQYEYPGEYFGSSVAIEGDTIIVGALEAQANAPGSAYFFSANSGGGTDAVVNVTPDEPLVGETLSVSVADHDQNGSDTTQDTISVMVQNTSTGGTVETLTLTETDVDTGVFEGTLNTVDAAGDDGFVDGSINVQVDDVVQVTYTDEFTVAGPSADRTDSVTFSAPLNGTDTVGAFYPSTGVWYLRDENNSGGPTVPTFTYGKGGVSVAGDWDGNGTDTVGAFYPSTGVWYLRDENSRGGPTVTPFTYGKGGVPVAGDWNNDGTDTIGVFYPATGTWYLRDDNSAGRPSVTPFTYGRGGVPVVGDWNNDGTDTVGVFYPSTGTWYLRDENAPGGPSVIPFTYGKGGVPVAGDWDSDGDDSIGVFYPSTGIWYVRNENAPGNPSVTPFTYGKGSRPVVGDWDGDSGLTSVSVPTGIATLTVVDADTGARVMVLELGAVIQRQDLPQNVQLVAEAYGGDTVIFDYQGVDDFATDSDAPFTLTGDSPTALADGVHILTATLYDAGAVVDTQTITFTVE